MKRLFVAVKVEPSPKMLEVYERMLEAFRYDKISWANPGNIHITLKFLGDTDENEIDKICNALEKCTTRSDPFEIFLEDVGIFGSRYDPKVIWFGIKENDQLQKLANYVLDELEKIGYERDRQNFVPHLTVGRIKKIKSKKRFQNELEQFKDLKIQHSRIESFALFESILKQTGAEHFVIRKFPLYAKDKPRN